MTEVVQLAQFVTRTGDSTQAGDEAGSPLEKTNSCMVSTRRREASSSPSTSR